MLISRFIAGCSGDREQTCVYFDLIIYITDCKAVSVILLKYDVRHNAILPGILHVHDKHILPKPNPIFCDQSLKRRFCCSCLRTKTLQCDMRNPDNLGLAVYIIFIFIRGEVIGLFFVILHLRNLKF